MDTRDDNSHIGAAFKIARAYGSGTGSLLVACYLTAAVMEVLLLIVQVIKEKNK